MQMLRMIIISGLVGLIAAGTIWFSWDLAGKFKEVFLQIRQRQRLKKEEKALQEKRAKELKEEEEKRK
jgi:YD repeat-containing protein